MKNFNLVKWIPVILWMALIFKFSSISQVKANNVFVFDFALKKLAHISEYAILFFLIFRATEKNWVISVFLTLAYAVTDEYHQSLVPGRSPSMIDLGLDLSGVNIAGYIIWKLGQNRQKKHKK